MGDHHRSLSRTQIPELGLGRRLACPSHVRSFLILCSGNLLPRSHLGDDFNQASARAITRPASGGTVFISFEKSSPVSICRARTTSSLRRLCRICVSLPPIRGS